MTQLFVCFALDFFFFLSVFLVASAVLVVAKLGFLSLVGTLWKPRGPPHNTLAAMRLFY